ncbi:RE1 [Symbiodinium sp. CCMP2592]|nr:RE1 [Symbiodinium sp. CCMP2592]
MPRDPAPGAVGALWRCYWDEYDVGHHARDDDEEEEDEYSDRVNTLIIGTSTPPVMGAQSTATATPSVVENPGDGFARPRGFLDLDDETVSRPQEMGPGIEELPADGGLRHPGAQLNGEAPVRPKQGTRAQRVGSLLSGVSAAVQGVVKASSEVRSLGSMAGGGPGSAGTEATVRTTGTGFATASEGDGGLLREATIDQDPTEPLFSAEQAERLETLAKAAPLIFPEAQSAPELPHSVSSGSGDAIQLEVRRQLQQFVVVQSEMERRIVALQRENEMLRRETSAGPGMDQGVRGWLGGISKSLMGLVHVPAKASHPSFVTASAVTTVSQVAGSPGGSSYNIPQYQVPTGVLLQGQAAGQVPAGVPQMQGQAAGQVPAGVTQMQGQAAGQVPAGVPQMQGQAAGQVPAGVTQMQGQAAGQVPAGVTQMQGQAAGQVPAGVTQMQGQAAGQVPAGVPQMQGQAAGQTPAGVHSVGSAPGQVPTGVPQGSGQAGGPPTAGVMPGNSCPQLSASAGVFPGIGQPSTNVPTVTPQTPYDAMMSGIVQLQGLMATLAAKPTGTGSGGVPAPPEVVRPGVTEIAKLPSATPEAALQFSDWVHSVRPSMSDLSDTSSVCWETVLAEAQKWYGSAFVPATPVQRLRLRLPTSIVDSEPRWSRVRHRMEHLVLQACPEAVREELSSARISGLLHVLCRLHVIYKPGGLSERTEALRQVQSPKAADSAVDAVLKLRTWRRWLTRLGDLGGSKPDPAMQIQALETITGAVLKSMSTVNFRVNLVRASLQLDTQPTNERVEEFFEHILAELESASRVSEASKEGKDRGQVRQVDAKAGQTTGADPGTGPKTGQPKPSVTPSAGGADAPKRLCKWFHEGKGCRKGADCAFPHEWNSIPKDQRADRCMRCGGKGHRKDSCTVPSGSPKSRPEASAPKASPKDAAPRKSGDPGLKKVLSEAASVLKEALRSTAGDADSQAESSSGPTGKAASPSGESPSAAARAAADPPVMATAAKIEAQLQDLEARVRDGARIRAVATDEVTEDLEPTALLDSGATHTVLDPTAVSTGDLAPCMVSLAGDQKQMWKQTPGGSLVAPRKDEGGETQTILPLGSLIEQLGCSIRWTRKGGLQLTHPKLGKLKTSIRSGCPQICKRQALQLVRELEGAHVGDLEGRLRRIQSRLAAQTERELHSILDEFVGAGTQVAAQALAERLPFLQALPTRVTGRLAVGLDGVNGWELMQAFPLNRRQRKKLHSSTSWVLSFCSGKGDPRLKAQCQAAGYDLVEIDLVRSKGWDLTSEGVWKAISWASYTGRVAAVLADPPMRSWAPMQTGEDQTTRVRTREYPWGVDGLKESVRARVDNDTLLGIQPLWAWTLASISKGVGIPLCYTSGDSGGEEVQAWDELVVKPFAMWSNCSCRAVPWTLEEHKWTKPMKVCSNLGLNNEGLARLGTQASKPEVCVARWPEGFRRQVTRSLFNPGVAQGSTDEPRVRVVEQGEGVAQTGEAQSDDELLKELQAIPLEGDETARDDSGPAASATKNEDSRSTGQGKPEALSGPQREEWRQHVRAHHIPFRKDCLQCVMSGSLGLQHRRSKCPHMYALSFDLAGPFKELGKDDRGGKYRYAMVAGLRVPCEALPIQKKGRRTTKSDPVVAADDSEARHSGPAEPSATQNGKGAADEEEETRSVASLFDPSDYDPEEFPDDPQDHEEPPRAESEEEDPWEDRSGVAKLSDEEFDQEVSQMVFSGDNRVLRFVVPMKGRSGAHILPALQEVITECHRLGYPVKVAHTDRAREAVSKATTDWLQSQLIQPSFTQGDDPKANGLAERLVGWVKTRARLHLSASGLGLEHWPTAMALACAQQRHEVLGLPGRVHQYGQRVVFKSKHPTGESKKPFLRWEYGTYLCPCTRTDKGHVLLRESSGGYLIARNVRPTDELVDPENDLGEAPPLEAQIEEEPAESTQVVHRRVTGKKTVKVVTLASEKLATELMEQGDYSHDACSRLLSAAFGSAVNHSRRSHRGSVSFSVVLGAYGHGGLRGVTKATYVHPQLCRYINAYLSKGSQPLDHRPSWSAVTIVQADEVNVHRDSRNEPESMNYVSTVADRTIWVSEQATASVRGGVQVETGRLVKVSDEREEPGNDYQLGVGVVSFDPKFRHALTPATNWVIAGYSPLGTRKLASDAVADLKEFGFNLPHEGDVNPPRVCKLVGPNPQRMPMPAHRRQRRTPVQTRYLNVRFARIPPEEWRVLCELEEEQFERRMERWTRVLSGSDEVNMSQLSAAIPRGLMVGTLRDGRQWDDDPILEYRLPNGQTVPLARVFQYTDDNNMYVDDSPFPDRLMMFDILDLQRDIREVVVIRVLVEEVHAEPAVEMERVMQEPGPSPPEIMAVQGPSAPSTPPVTPMPPAAGVPRQLPVPLPNPTALVSRISGNYVDNPHPQEELSVRKAEVATTPNSEQLLETLVEPLSVTHTASQGEVRQNLTRWRAAIQKELDTLKGGGVLQSHVGEEARKLLSSAEATVIPLKGVFTAKAPAAGSQDLFKRKCRLVACGNQAPYNDAESLYASGAPAELVRAALVRASGFQWGAFTCDIRSAFTLTPIPPEAGRRYVLRPPRWLIELGLAQEGECYTLGKVLYGFRESPVWWSTYRDEVLRSATFDGCELVQGSSDPSIWRIQKGNELKGYLITYVDDFLVLGESSTAHAFHRWILDTAKWETDGLSEAREGSPVRFLGMQLEKCADGAFTLDQEAYVDEIIRAHGLAPSMRSKITCPKEVMFGDEERPSDADDPEGDALSEEQAVKLAQRMAGECLWLSQRTRVDIAFTTSMMCSMVATEPRKAVAIGKRLLMYLAQTKEYRLRLHSKDDVAALRIYTDASFSPEGKHSYGGHILEFQGSPVVWRAGRQQIIAMSSAESELIQVVEGAIYGESFMALLKDLGVTCTGAAVEVDNTAAISLVKGGCSQRTRHLKGQEDESTELQVDYPWELLLATLLIVLSTVCLWETLRGRIPARQVEGTGEGPKVRAVSVSKEKRSRRLQERVQAAIASAVSETSPSGASDAGGGTRRGRNKCPLEQQASERLPSSPLIQAGVVHVHNPADPRTDANATQYAYHEERPSSSTAVPVGIPYPPPGITAQLPPEAYRAANHSPPGTGQGVRTEGTQPASSHAALPQCRTAIKSRGARDKHSGQEEGSKTTPEQDEADALLKARGIHLTLQIAGQMPSEGVPWSGLPTAGHSTAIFDVFSKPWADTIIRIALLLAWISVHVGFASYAPFGALPQAVFAEQMPHQAVRLLWSGCATGPPSGRGLKTHGAFVLWWAGVAALKKDFVSLSRYCASSDPGQMAEDPLEQGGALPPRAHKSWLYPKPILRHDHYCRWLHNVIGLRNHRAFIAMLVSLAMLVMAGLLADAWFLFSMLHKGIRAWPIEALCLLHVGFSLLFLRLELQILRIQVGLVSRNELNSEWKEDFFWTAPSGVPAKELDVEECNELLDVEALVYDASRNEFDNGCLNNCWVFWCRSRSETSGDW